MSKWQEKRLGEVAEINMGQSPKSIYYNKDNIGTPFLQGNGDFGRIFPIITTYTSSVTKVAHAGDILFSVRAPVGAINIANTAVCIGRGLSSIRSKENYNHIFLRYSLEYLVNEIKKSSNGAIFDSITKNDLYNSRISIPDLATQEKITDILSTYDDLIENNNRRIEILEQMAQEIYKEWFVRFRFPGHEKVKFINGLPEDWEVVKLGDFVNIKGGKRLPTGKDFCIEQTEHPYIRIRDISKYKFIPLTENMMYIDNATFNILNRFTVKKGDLLISIVGTIGLVACVGSTLNGANLTENCVNITEVRHFTKSYLYHYLKSSQGQGELYSGIVGVSQPKLPIYNIKKFKLLKPSQKLIIDFTNLVADIDSKMNNLLEQNQNLIKQRDLLLPRLMSGKLEV